MKKIVGQKALKNNFTIWVVLLCSITFWSSICEILEAELHHRMDIDTIYIHPRPKDYRMFMTEHFSLSVNKMTEVVKSGFKAAIEVLHNYGFEGIS